MPQAVDWYLHRRNCATCAKSQSFLQKNCVPIKETTDARKTRLGRAEALELARSANRVVVVRGAIAITFDLKRDRPSDEELMAVMLGPTGNLRAPTIRRGKTLVVGFNPDAYRDAVT